MQENVPLGPLTTIGVGGPARYYCRVESAEDVRRLLGWAAEREIPWLVLGGGSNVVVADEGFPGLVLHAAMRGLAVVERDDEVLVTAAAGEDWDGFVAQCVDRAWTGLECLSGIPGRVGASPIQNVGAYGQEVCERIESVSAYDTVDQRVREFTNAECLFAYRDSRFKTHEAGRHIVLTVTFRLHAGGMPSVRYAELSRALAERGLDRPSVYQVREAVLGVRRRKSMVVDPADPNSRSCGSFFVNPIVTCAALDHVREVARREGVLGPTEEAPHYPAGDDVKLSAAWLIERAGFAKGYVRGRAGLSERHCLAIINRGSATAADILALMTEIREGVFSRFGVTLTPEPVFVGMSDCPWQAPGSQTAPG